MGRNVSRTFSLDGAQPIEPLWERFSRALPALVRVYSQAAGPLAVVRRTDANAYQCAEGIAHATLTLFAVERDYVIHRSIQLTVLRYTRVIALSLSASGESVTQVTLECEPDFANESWEAITSPC